MNSDQQGVERGKEVRRRTISHLQLLDACEEGRLESARDLLKSVGDINFRDDEGNTALHWAVRSGRKDVITELTLSSGIKLSVENQDRETPLDLAWDSVKQEINEDLKRKKMDAVFLPLKEAILKEAKSIVRVQQNQSPHVAQKSTLSFYEEVLNGISNPTLSNEDIKIILKFFWPAWNKQSKVKEKITFQLFHGDLNCVSLLQTEHGISFVIEKSKGPAEVPSESNTEALHKLQLFKEELKDYDEQQSTQPSKRSLPKLLDVKGKLAEKLVRPMEKSSENCANKFFANVLNELDINKSKFLQLENLLKDVLEKKPFPLNFSFQSANVLIFALETFALQGIDPTIPLPKKENDQLSQYKKCFFLRFFPKDPAAYHKIFTWMRATLVKKGNKILLHNLDAFFAERKIGIKDLMDSLLEFCQHVSRMREDVQELSSASKIAFNSIKSGLADFLKIEKDKRLKTSDVTSRSEIRKFCESVDKMQGGQSQLREELIFELLVNIFPLLDTKKGHKKPYIYHLRNSVIHKLGAEEFQDSIARAMHDYYRYELSRNIHDVLQAFRGPYEQKTLENKLNATFKLVNQNFPSMKMNLPEGVLKSDHSVHSGDCFWTEENEDDIIYLYVKYLAPFFDKYSDNDSDEDWEATQIDISDAQKMTILKDLWHVFLNPKLKNKDEQAFSILRKLPLSGSHLNSSNEERSSSENKLKGEVKEVMNNLSNLCNKRKDFGHDDLINLFKAFMRGKGAFLFRNHYGLLDHLELTDREKKIIEDCLNSFPNVHRGRKLDTAVQVSLSSIILSLLKLKHRFKEYNLRAESISSAFRDDTFIDFLVNHSVQRNPKDESDFNFKCRTYKVLRDLREIKFAHPYVAALLAEIKNAELIDKEHLESLLSALMKGNLPSQYLEGLLSLRKQWLLETSSMVLMKEELSEEAIEAFFRALCRTESLSATFDCLIDKLRSLEYQTESLAESTMKKLLAAANAVVLENIDADKLDFAEDILRSLKRFEEELKTNIFTNEYEHCLLLRAKLHIQKGRKVCKHVPVNSGPCEGSQQFVQAVEFLNKISEPLEISQSDRYLLALSRKAYAFFLLVKCTGVSSWAEDLQMCSNKLWQLMWSYVTSSKEEPPQFETFYHRAIFSRTYQSLLTTNTEYSKYLNLNSALKTKTTFYLFEVHTKFQNINNTLKCIDLINKDLNSWKEIYFSILKYQQFHQNSVPLILQRYLSSAHHALAKQYYNSGAWCDYQYHWLKSIEYQNLRHNTLQTYFGDFSPRLTRTLQFIKDWLEEYQFKSEFECKNRCSLEIQGVRETQGENCHDVVKKIAEVLGVDLKGEDICYAEREEIKYPNQLHRSIIIKFTDYSICNRLKISHKRNQPFAEFEEERLFINRIFARDKHVLLRQARTYFNYCYVNIDDEGRIYVRKRCTNPDARNTNIRHYINNQQDFEKVANSLN